MNKNSDKKDIKDKHQCFKNEFFSFVIIFKKMKAHLIVNFLFESIILYKYTF